MEKSTVKEMFMSGYRTELSLKTYNEMEAKIKALDSYSNNEKSTFDLINQIRNAQPEFEILNEYIIRKKLNSIDSNLKTIKTILLIAFIISQT